MSSIAPADRAAASAHAAPLVVALFFAWGFCTVLVDVLTPKLKGLFQLSYAEAMLTQFAFFGAYFVVSIPAGALIDRIGYARGVVTGLCVMAAGCLMFTPAAALGVYPGFLAALFVLAGGITVLQVAANPLMAGLGPPEGAHSRLTLAQAFNSLGTFIGPVFGAALILRQGEPAPPRDASEAVLSLYRRAEAGAVQGPFLGIALTLVVAALVIWARRKAMAQAASTADGAQGRASYLQLLARPRLALGAACIFLYVGAEVAIGSAMVNYLLLPKTAAATAAVATWARSALPWLAGASAVQAAGAMVSLYWGGAMVGRFVGAGVLRIAPAPVVLTVCALSAAALATASALLSGAPAVATLLAVGLFNSVMFPTVFTLAIEGLGEDTPRASGLLCLAIVGGAVVPLVMGLVADRAGLSAALAAPALCYVCVAAYGVVAASVWRAGSGGHGRMQNGGGPGLQAP